MFHYIKWPQLEQLALKTEVKGDATKSIAVTFSVAELLEIQEYVYVTFPVSFSAQS